MALRPTELQIILAATRDIERIQQIQQQQPHLQQELIAVELQRQAEERRRQTQSAAKVEQKGVSRIGLEGKKQEIFQRKRRKAPIEEDRKNDAGRGPSQDHIVDLLV